MMRLLLLILLLPGCIERNNGPGPIGNVDSESHWLRPCADDTQCGALACICGVCSRSCRDVECGGEATCAPLGADTCDAVPACTAECAADDDCPGAMRCIDGVCDAPAGCAGDGECPDDAACRDAQCVPLEICGDGVDQDGDGGDCDDADCLSEAACAETAAAFEPPPDVVACGAPDPLPEGLAPAAALAATAQAEADALAALAQVADALAAQGGALESPTLQPRLDAVVAALDAARAALADRVEACAAPACDPTALLAAELALLGAVMDAIDRLDHAGVTLLPYTDCVLATARLRLWRRSRHMAAQCPAHDPETYEAPLAFWQGWAHDGSLRLRARCVARAGHDVCAAALGADAIGSEAGCE